MNKLLSLARCSTEAHFGVKQTGAMDIDLLNPDAKEEKAWCGPDACGHGHPKLPWVDQRLFGLEFCTFKRGKKVPLETDRCLDFHKTIGHGPSAQCKHKLKRMIQSPNSFFMDVKCPGCLQVWICPKWCKKKG